VSFYLKVPKPQGFKYRILKKEGIELRVEAIGLTEPNAARSELGATATASVDGNLTIETNGDITLNNQPNTDFALEWIVLDFHKERQLNEVALTVKEVTEENILFDLKIWGGTIFFPSSPPVIEAITKNAQPQTVRQRFAEQRTEKALIEFGTLDGDKKFINNTPLILTNIEIKAFSFPSDLSFGIGDQPPFFIHQGELAPDVFVALPDFSNQLNTFLENNEPEEKNGDLLIPLSVSSRTDGIVSFKRFQDGQAADISSNLVDLGYLLQGVITGFLTAADTSESKEQIALDFSSADQHSVLISLPPLAKVLEAQFHIRGALSEDRLLLDNTGEADRLGVLGSEDFLLAQRFQINMATSITSVGVMLEFLTGEAEVSVAIHSEFQGQPGESALPGSEIVRQFSMPEEPEVASTPLFVEFKYTTPLDLDQGKYWIVLAATDGQLTWRANEAQPNLGGFMYTRLDGSTNWIQRRHPSTGKAISGIFKITYLPLDTSDLIKIEIGGIQGMIPDIPHPAQINQDVTALIVIDQVTRLLDLLNKMNSPERPALTFSTSAKGTLTISDLHIAFEV
jgi:hypothetical protein